MISSSFSNCHQHCHQFFFFKMRNFVGRLLTSNYVNCQSLVWISHITDYYSPSLCQTNKTIPSVCWKSAIILVSFHVKDYQNAKIANSWRKRINSTFQIEEKNVLFLCLKSLCFKLTEWHTWQSATGYMIYDFAHFDITRLFLIFANCIFLLASYFIIFV